MTITDVRNNSVELSTVGLDDEMITRMTADDIDAYFTAENFTAMFGECTMSDDELATLRIAAGWQKYWLRHFSQIA